MLKPGDPAPDFTLIDQHGREVRLSSFRGGPVIVYFYPKNNTPACTAEACAFRDEHEQFRSVGAVVIGISSDSRQSHASFSGRHSLPFHLLSDAGGEVRKRWQVPGTLGLFPGRVTYIVDADGTIREIVNSALRPHKHVRHALRAVHATAPGASIPHGSSVH